MKNQKTPLLAGKKVLMVEDEYLIAIDAEEILRRLGAIDVELVGTFDQAATKIQAGDFDVAIIDVNLNGIESFPLGEMLKALERPFVFASGYNFERGSPVQHAWVTKPYDLQSLSSALERVLVTTPN